MVFEGAPGWPPPEGFRLKETLHERTYQSPILHPLTLLGIWVGVGCLFALQEFAELRNTPNHISLRTSLTLWSIYTLCSAAGFLSVWIPMRGRIQNADWKFSLGVLLPLSFVASVAEEMVYVMIFPLFVTPMVHRTYWGRLQHVLAGEFVTNMAFFWIAIFIARGVGYYEAARQNEILNSRLASELTGAQLRALRMQLNPHFLFNAMNGISSLMHVNPDMADRMLEQLSRLLRMTLERGELQQVRLREEMDFVQLYLEIQRMRFGDRLQYAVEMPAELCDAMIPTMILQPIVENAYVHGIAPSPANGWIRIGAQKMDGHLDLCVRNSGQGIREQDPARNAIGVKNVKSRLHLHYGTNGTFTLCEASPGVTEARLTLPLEIDHSGPGLMNQDPNEEGLLS